MSLLWDNEATKYLLLAVRTHYHFREGLWKASSRRQCYSCKLRADSCLAIGIVINHMTTGRATPAELEFYVSVRVHLHLLKHRGIRKVAAKNWSSERSLEPCPVPQLSNHMDGSDLAASGREVSDPSSSSTSTAKLAATTVRASYSIMIQQLITSSGGRQIMHFVMVRRRRQSIAPSLLLPNNSNRDM